MFILPAVSSRECIGVLRRLGFHSVDEIDGARILERENHRVRVPQTNLLENEPLLFILRDAGIPVTTFLDYLGLLEAG